MKIRLLKTVYFLSLPLFFFAQQTVGLFLNTPSAQNGYTLFCNNEKTYLIDNCGFTINIWESQHEPGLGVYLLENGDLLRAARMTNEFSGGHFEKFDWDGNLIWSYEYLDNNAQTHHDIEPLPNGNFLAIAWEKHPTSDAQQNGRIYEGEVWSECIIEFEITDNNQANIVWKWRLWDHLIQDQDSSKLNYGNISEHPELVDINFIGDQEGSEEDWIHLNALDYNPSLDQIALSSRNFSEIWIIDHSTSTAEAATHIGGNSEMGGDILYRYGNPLAYQRGTSSDQVLFQQHDVRWSEDGQQLSVFNNQYEHEKSAVQIWTPPIKNDGNYLIEPNQPFGPNHFDWEYSAEGFYSKYMSSAQHLPNGNILICEADDGRLIEMTKEKEIVWEYINPVNSMGSPVEQGSVPIYNDLFRGTKYAADFPAFMGKDLTPGPPVELNPWPADCELNPTGIINNNALNNQVTIYGNPVVDHLKINSTINSDLITMNIFDLTGKHIFQKEINYGLTEINSQDISSGIYFLVFRKENGETFSKKISVIN